MAMAQAQKWTTACPICRWCHHIRLWTGPIPFIGGGLQQVPLRTILAMSQDIGEHSFKQIYSRLSSIFVPEHGGCLTHLINSPLSMYTNRKSH